MAKKFDFDWKNFLLQKGEKVGLGVGAGVMGLMLIFGVKGVFSGSPSTNAKALNDKTDQAKNLIARNTPRDMSQFEVDPSIMVASGLVPVDADAYREDVALFVPFAPGDSLRREPKILSPVELEATFVVAMVKSFMFDKEFKKVMVLRGENIKADKNQNARLSGNLQQMMGNRGGGMPGMGMGGMGMGMGGMGGMGMGGMGMGGMMPGGGARQGVGPGAANQGQGRGVALRGLQSGGRELDRGALGSSESKDQSKKTGFVPIEEVSKLTDARLADRVLPVRMVIFEGSFPLKKQLEEYRSALHLPSDVEAFKELTFNGFDVERREVERDGQPALGPDGKPSTWAAFGIEEAFKIVITTNGKRWDKKLDDLFALVQIRGLSYGLPEQIDRGYPTAYDDKKLPHLKTAIEGIKNKEQVAETIQDSRFEKAGDQDIYGGSDAPAAQQGNAGAIGGAGVAGPGKGGVGGTAKAAGAGGGGLMQPGGVSNTTAVKSAGSGANMDNLMGSVAGSRPGELPEYCLLRFIDVTVEPGKTYEYRYRIRVKNPNEGRFKEVAYKSLAEAKVVKSSQWIEVGKRISIPNDFQYYAVDMKEVEPTKYRLFNSPGKDQVAMQLHRWVDEFNPAEGRGDHPVGDWAAAEHVLVNRGEYVGGKHSIVMPVWDFYEENFVIAAKPGARALSPRVMMPFTESDTQCPVLVHFEGGTVSTIKPEDRRPVEDTDIPHEVVLLSPEGRLIVRNSADDKQNKDRQEHFDAWRGRIQEIKDKLKEKKEGSNKTQGADTGTGGPFGKGGKQ